jgi:hypothetical protein
MQPFPDYGFKLAVLDVLLESGSFIEALEDLKSQPHIANRLSGDVAYGETITEMDHFFRAVELTQEDLLQVKELCFDGGNEIYHLITPFWSGEDDQFDILSVDGFEALANLESVLNISMISDEQIDRLSAAGIRID